jgi:hypothetical protein
MIVTVRIGQSHQSGRAMRPDNNFLRRTDGASLRGGGSAVLAPVIVRLHHDPVTIRVVLAANASQEELVI